MDFKHHPRKLNFNAPLLSTRRPGGRIGNENGVRGKFQETSNRIPFCWEEAPGKPKDSDKNEEYTHDVEFHTPRLRIPPCRWHPHDHDNDSNAIRHELNQDDANDDDRDNNNNNNDYLFSDAMDVMSLTEAIDIAEKAEENHHKLDGFNLESLDSSNNSISPSYIIERFLPDATALAASSVMDNTSKNLRNPNPPYGLNYMEPEPFNTAKGCGLEMLIPWRMKHRICGVKSPVRAGCVSVVQPHHRSRSKRSMVRPFGDAKNH